MHIKKVVPIYSLCLAFLILLMAPAICFADNQAVNANTSQTEEECASCHQSQAEAFASGIHSENGYTCTDCHQDHEITGVISVDDLKSNPQDIAGTCGQCHGNEVLQSYQESFHGRALALGSMETASCASCHGAHKIVSTDDSNSPVNQENVAVTCAECHVKPLASYAMGTEHKLLAAQGAGAPQYWTFKFFVWLTILTVIGLILHMELDLFALLRSAKQKAKK